MKEIYAQITNHGNSMSPYSTEYRDILKSFKTNQVVRVQIYGTRKKRSVDQNKWVHAMFRVVAANTEDPDWDTPEKVKRNVKMSMKFFKDDVIVHNNKVYFELRSFAFDKMEQDEANTVYNHAKSICALKIKVSEDIIEANAKRN